MKRFLVFSFVTAIKFIARIFYSFEVTWVNDSALKNWSDVRVFAFLNHTSLFEPLFVSTMPFHFLWRGSKAALVPIADKTMNRKFVGPLLSFMSPEVISVTRKKDESWSGFLARMKQDTVVCIAPEGRMLRADGLDSLGKPLTVRGGIADIIEGLDSGTLLIGYSGGLHHVQTPGEKIPRLFKKIAICYEAIDIRDFKREISAANKRDFKLAVVKQLEARKQRYSPYINEQ